jgi:hypothetical protein
MAHLTVSMAPQFYDFYLWRLRNTAWPPLRTTALGHWFSNGAPQELARCAANIMKIYFKNEKKPICIEIFIHSLKCINIFLILYTKCARKFLYFTVRREPKGLRTAALRIWIL